MPSKRKRDILDFDPNKSDSEDENFEPEADRPARSRKKSRPAKSRPSGPRKKTRYRGSDIEDDEELSDSEQDDSFGDNDDDEEDDEEEAPINENTGRRMRKAAVKRQNYKESSDDDESIVQESDDKDELIGETPKKKRKIVVLNLRNASMSKIPASSSANPPTAIRRSTRARTAETEGELVELSNSGKHVLPARGSRDISPGAAARNSRVTRGGKGLKKSPEPPIEEATQETSSHENGTQLVDDYNADAMDEDVKEESARGEDIDQLVTGDIDQNQMDEDQPVETVEPDEADDEDDGPITRRTRGARAGASSAAAVDSAEPEPTTAPSRRLTRKSRMKKSAQEPSSDFEPGNDSGEDNESAFGKAKDNSGGDCEDESSSSNARGRRGKKRARPTRSQRRESGDEAEEELDRDELAEELEELRESSRSRRRLRRRTTTPIEYDIKTRRTKPVDYTIRPLDQLAVEPEIDQDPAPTPARRRRAGGTSGWERNLHTIAGPFGGMVGGGPGALFGGPWGTGATAGVDSDSSDDEMGQRSGVAGQVGMTPTSAAPAPLLGGHALPHGMEGLGGLGTAAPNVGKVKNQKTYADADPLGVDMNVDFSKVGGLEGHIDQLKEMVQLPLLYPELFMKFHVTPPRGVLFHGPPGTGKTLVARALANSVGIGGKKITFYMRKGADALSKWVGEAEKQLRLLFEEARRTQPSIIFFDEIDGLAPVRSSKQEQIHASIVSTLLALMDGMDGRGQVIVIGATNRPDNIDPALRRPGRFDREFYFPLPDVQGRRAIIDIHTKDWGLSDDFKNSLARDAKGFGGADLRALCTEAAMNAIQRTYPQIYSSKEKLVADPEKITIHMTDFSLSKKKVIPSSERSSTSGAAPLPKAIEPLLRNQFDKIKKILDDILPRKKKTTALEEAMFEPYEDDDFGYRREALNDEFERSRVFRPRLLISGVSGMGQSYLSSAMLHYLEGVHVQNFDLPTIVGDQRTPEQVLVGLFTEVKRHKPSIIFIPNVDTWYESLQRLPGAPITAFLSMLRSIPPTDPIMVLGTSESDMRNLSPDLKHDVFGFSRKNNMEIARPTKENRQEYFTVIIDHIRRSPKEFPDPARRKKRVLEKLVIAPPPPPKVLTKEEEKNEWLRYRHCLNLMKVHLQPIMEQINRKYKKFRTKLIPYHQYQYLFDEQDPNYIRPDVEGAVPRPFEIAKDKDGIEGLRETATGKFYYNLDIQTIEERLANGFYVKPLDFLRDVDTLKHDAKLSGDRERILKASELMSNVEVDVNDVHQKLQAIPWDEMFQKEQQRRAKKAEKNRKRKAMQSVVDMVTSDVASGNVNSQQHTHRLHTTSAQFRVMSPLFNGNGGGISHHPNTNGTTVPSGIRDDDVHMMDADTRHGVITSPMQQQLPSQWPPMDPRQLGISTRATVGGTAQISQVSALQSLPPGVSPSALVNDASTTKTSDPSNRSSNWTNVTNGIYGDQSSPIERIPDTLPLPSSQGTSGEDPWLRNSQIQDVIQPPPFSQSTRTNPSSGAAKSSYIPSMANLLNDPSPNEQSQAQRHSGHSSASQVVELDEQSGKKFLGDLTSRTSGCTIEQLEQITREMMTEIWRTKGETNRMRVLDSVTSVFNEAINDIEEMQRFSQFSQ